MQYSDQEILESISNGKDAKVLQFLYDTVLPKVRQLVINNNGDAEEAYDAFQEAVMKFYALVKKGKFQAEGSIGGFIYTVSKRLWLNRIRKENKIIHLNEDTDVPDENNQETELISEEKAFLITQLFSKLGDGCKNLLNYTIYQKLTMKEIAQKMNFASQDVAKTRHYKCKKKLVELVKQSSFAQEMLRQ